METQQLDKFIRRIEQIDCLLKPAVKSLLEEADQKPPESIATSPEIFFRPWLSEFSPPPPGEYLLTRAVCSGTLMRLLRVRRRFPWLQKSIDRLAKNEKSIEERIAASFSPKDESSCYDFDNCLLFLQSETFGPLNPLTASSVFSTLMDAGEAYAHSGVGVLAFFAMVWALDRGKMERSEGVQLEPWESSAYIAAKCLLPIRSLRRLSLSRAQATRQIYECLFSETPFDDSLEGLAQRYETLYDKGGESDPYLRWRFASLLEKIASLLLETAKISLVPEPLQNSSKVLQEKAENLNNSNLTETHKEVIEILYKTLSHLISERNQILEKVQTGILEQLPTHIQAIILKAQKLERDEATPTQAEKAEKSADSAIEYCKEAIEKLMVSPKAAVSGAPKDIGEFKQHLQSDLLHLENKHREFADFLDRRFKPHARWCASIVRREIAHISAGNETAFDPSELVNAILVAMHWDEMGSELQVRDAVVKALMGARKDGSWTPGPPFFTSGRALSIVPTTSDIVWPLATAISSYPVIDVSDETFERYLDWLERTRMVIAPVVEDGQQARRVHGWASDRARGSRRVDLWASALAINALLQIREIYEYRLWQLCEECYTVLPVDMRMSDIDPVDLALLYKKQLYHKLSEVFRNVQDDKSYEDAKYTFVLHGPPGSSKTVTANAIANEMWRSAGHERSHQPRFVRITPADFTHKGEDSLDAEARVIFRLLQRLRKVTVFFDEIDDLLHKRDPTKDPTFMTFIVPAMLNRLQDLRDACPQQEICVIFATNYVDQIERALLRKGRVDKCLPIVYQDWESRQLLVWKHLHKKFFPKLLLKKEAMKDKWPEFVTRLKEVLNKQIVEETKAQPWKVVNDVAKSFASSLVVSNIVTEEANIEEKAKEARRTQHEALSSKYEYPKERDYSSPVLRQEILTYTYSTLPPDGRSGEKLLMEANKVLTKDPDNQKFELSEIQAFLDRVTK